ncbi:MAG: hypothetical protein WB902_26615 [Acetobacteraceae bacterium]
MLNEVLLLCGQEHAHIYVMFALTPIVVVVGPNGSGKSLLLRELESFFKPRLHWGFAARVLVERVGLNVDWKLVEADRQSFAKDERIKAQWPEGTFQPYKLNPLTQGRRPVSSLHRVRGLR